MTDKLLALIAAEANKPVSEVTLDSTFEALGFDSLAIVEAVLRVEDEFGVTIPDDAAHAMKTVGDLATFLEAA
jgi:acyl carrier protein